MSVWHNNYVDNNTHGHVEPVPPTNVRPWSRVVGTCGDHTCVVNRRREFYDRTPVHGDTYLGRCASDKDAFNRWKNHLMTIGERHEEARFHDAEPASHS